MSKRSYLNGSNCGCGNSDSQEETKTLREEIQGIGGKIDTLVSTLSRFFEDLETDKTTPYHGKHELPAEPATPTPATPANEENKTYLKVIYFSKSRTGELEWRQPLYNKRVALAFDPDAVGVCCLVDKDGYFVRQAKPNEIKGVYIE